MDRKDRLILIAEIRQAHGLKGEVRLTSYSEDPKALIAYSPLLTSSGKPVTVEQLKPAKGAWLAVLKDVRDRNASEALKGEKLFVPRERLPKPAEGEWYHADLIGLTLLDLSGSAIGRVEGVVNYGGGDLLEVAAAGKPGTVLVPFRGASVDLVAGLIRIDLPEGLLED